MYMASICKVFQERLYLFLTLFAVAATGCSPGPQRYSVSGQLVYEGEAVASGRLVFTPDHTAGNAGPQGVAMIKNGEIITQGDRRVIGGPHWVQIIAFDGVPYEDGEGLVSHGHPLFPLVQAPIHLPEADATLIICVVGSSEGPQVEITVE